jgi:hypothetical protein
MSNSRSIWPLKHPEKCSVVLSSTVVFMRYTVLKFCAITKVQQNYEFWSIWNLKRLHNTRGIGEGDENIGRNEGICKEWRWVGPSWWLMGEWWKKSVKYVQRMNGKQNILKQNLCRICVSKRGGPKIGWQSYDYGISLLPKNKTQAYIQWIWQVM